MILAALVLIGCIPVGVDARYNADGVFLAAKLGPFRLQLLPQKPKKKPKKRKQQQKRPEKATASSEPQEKKSNPLLSGGVDGMLQLLDLAFDTLGDLRRKLRVNELTLHVLIGGAEDPAKAAMGYGRAWAAIGAITPSLERLFVIKKRDIRPALDYTISNTQVDAHLVTTITIGRSLALAVHAGIRFLKLLNERKKAV